MKNKNYEEDKPKVSEGAMLTEKPKVTEVAQPAPAKPKYRLACEGCTGIALFSTNTMVGIKVNCMQCGKEQTAKAENYIAL